MFSLGLLLVLFPFIAAEQGTVGHYFKSATAKTSGSQGVFLFEQLAIPEGVVYKFGGYCVINETARVQIWRPLDLSRKLYQLRAEWTLIPSKIPGRCEMEFYEKADYILVATGDRFALYNENDASPFAYRLNANQGATSWAVSLQTALSLGDEVDFDEGIPMPYEFSLEIFYDTDTTVYQQEGRRSVKSTTATPTIPPITIPAIPPNEGTILYTGNSVGQRLSYHSSGARGSFLIHHLKLPRSKLLSFFMYAAFNAPVWLQVWRFAGEPSQYSLVGQIKVDVVDAPKALEIVLPEGEYIDVEDGDMLGFTNEMDSGCIGYTFQAAADYPQPYFASLSSSQSTENIKDVVTFETIGMPYEFAIGAKTDIDIDKYADITRPTHKPSAGTTTMPPTTVSDVLSNMKEDRTVGYSLLVPATKRLASPGKRSWVLAGLEFPVEAKVTSFAGYCAVSGGMQYEVWRKIETSDGSLKMKLIGSKSFNASPTPGFQRVVLADDEQFLVQPGDMLGFSNSEESVPIGYRFSPADMYYATPGQDLEPGATLEFETQKFPYLFSYAASYAIPSDVDGVSTTAGSVNQETNPTNTVPSVPSLSTKQSSAIVSTTTTTTTTTPSPSTVARPRNEASSSDEDESWLETPEFMLALLVWLILLSFLFILLVVVLLCKRRSPGHVDYLHQYDSRPISAYSNYGMKADETVDYFNPSVRTSPKTNGSAALDCVRET